MAEPITVSSLNDRMSSARRVAKLFDPAESAQLAQTVLLTTLLKTVRATYDGYNVCLC